MSFNKKVLFLILSISMFNYIDRYVLASVFPLIQQDLKLSDTQLGILASAFMIVYTLISPFMGFIGDRIKRHFVIGFSAIFWSIATVFSGLSKNFFQLSLTRAFVGIGEAGYGTVSPSYLAEWFDLKIRARILSLYALAIPFGSAIGYLLGGYLGQKYGWRQAFYIVGLPGIILGILAFTLKETPEREKSKEFKFSDYKVLFRNKTYLLISFSQAIATFSVGGLSAWMPTFYVRNWNITVAEAGFKFGVITVIAGILGNLSGGFMADYLREKVKRAYFIVGYLSFFLSIPFAILAIFSENLNLSLLFIFLSEFFIFWHSGPYHAAIVEIIPVSIRSMAFAINIFILHAFGDAISPMIIGYISDKTELLVAIFFSSIYLIFGGITSILAGFFYNKNYGKDI